MFKRPILDSAYFLQTSQSYQATKQFVYDILENHKCKYKKYIDAFMIFE